jgi:uncharacterized protein (TIGR00106 family)
MIVDVSVVPIGTGSTGVSRFVREVLRVARASGLKYQVGPMGTSLEGDWDGIFRTIRQMHEVCFKMGAGRLLTSIKVDDRRDRVQTMQEKLDRVNE